MKIKNALLWSCTAADWKNVAMVTRRRWRILRAGRLFQIETL